MPALGVAQEKGTLISWFKTEGQSVAKGEPLMEVETDKATVEIEAPASGILTDVTALPGDEVPVGNRIALICAPGEKITINPPTTKTGTHQDQDKVQKTAAATTESGTKTAARVSKVTQASPAARRIAREKGLDLSSLRGTGPEGAILTADVLRARPSEPVQGVERERVHQTIPLSPMRRIVGQRMSQSKQAAPHFYLGMDIDMTAVNEKRTTWKQTGQSVVPSINDFILHACAHALKQFPMLNSTFTNEGIRLLAEINIGMAVALDEGLVVPVIRSADQMSLMELAGQSRELIEKAQTKKLLPLDYDGGTFTVSNLGTLGVDNFVAIINPPQCAILAVGRVAPRVVADEEGMMIRSMMTATLSADHRIVDGASATRFLTQVKDRLENPA
jgi:pyruvate dehydrogenase E2 component (dihydrolipoamide acetyltransferase)